jgi:hypothetical protein
MTEQTERRREGVGGRRAIRRRARELHESSIFKVKTDLSTVAMRSVSLRERQ